MYSKESIKPDIVKKEYDGVEFNILGIEIQDKVHYAMPLLILLCLPFSILLKMRYTQV